MGQAARIPFGFISVEIFEFMPTARSAVMAALVARVLFSMFSASWIFALSSSEKLLPGLHHQGKRSAR